MPPSNEKASRVSDSIHQVKKTPMLLLRKRVEHLTSDNSDFSSNSDYVGPVVDLDEVQLWENFTADISQEIISLLEKDEQQLKNILNREFTEAELETFTWGCPYAGPNTNEQTFERLWAAVVHSLNTVQVVCASEIQGTPKPTYIVIGDGSCAGRKAPGAKGTEQKRPDFAGLKHVLGSGQHVGDEKKNTPNRIPGDAKLFRKIRRSMLPPDGKEYHARQGFKTEAQKVINQIYDYMDQHEARYGYVVNDQELIFFRRRSSGWGHLDISPAIRHDVDADVDNGILNSKFVLFYYHFAVANVEAEWRLGSCRHLIVWRRSARLSVNQVKPKLREPPSSTTVAPKKAPSINGKKAGGSASRKNY
jgi:hypothetical protein